MTICRSDMARDTWFFVGCTTKDEWASGFKRMMTTPYSAIEKSRRDYQRDWKGLYINEDIIPFYHNDRSPDDVREGVYTLSANRDLKALNAYREKLIPFDWLRWILARSNYVDYDDITERALQNFLHFGGWLNY